MTGTLILRSCNPGTTFRPATHSLSCNRQTQRHARCAAHSSRQQIQRQPRPLPQPETQPEPKSRLQPAALAALLPAAAWLQPGAAWAATLQAQLQTELPRATALYELADLDAKTAGLLARVLQPLLAVSQLLLIARIVLSWYPQVNSKKLPWSIAVVPTEPVLGPTRRAIPPIGGVDIAPIIWFAALSFTNEILVGPQGILNLLQRKL